MWDSAGWLQWDVLTSKINKRKKESKTGCSWLMLHICALCTYMAQYRQKIVKQAAFVATLAHVAGMDGEATLRRYPAFSWQISQYRYYCRCVVLRRLLS